MATHAFETTGYDAFRNEPTGEPSPAAPAPPTGSPDDSLGLKGWACARERRTDQPLSPRERQILTLIIDGKTRKEVAYDLAIAHSTVRVLYSRAMKKLGGHWEPIRRRPESRA